MGLGLVPQTLYLFRMKRWQVFQVTYSLISFVSKKEVWSCFGDSTQLCGN